MDPEHNPKVDARCTMWTQSTSINQGKRWTLRYQFFCPNSWCIRFSHETRGHVTLQVWCIVCSNISLSPGFFIAHYICLLTCPFGLRIILCWDHFADPEKMAQHATFLHVVLATISKDVARKLFGSSRGMLRQLVSHQPTCASCRCSY